MSYPTSMVMVVASGRASTSERWPLLRHEAAKARLYNECSRGTTPRPPNVAVPFSGSASAARRRAEPELFEGPPPETLGDFKSARLSGVLE